MNCPQFLERFSDYYDRTGEDAFLAAVEEHLDGCEECRRYVEVVRRGSELLHAFPQLEVSDDFEPRLRHRIYHIEDGDALTPGSAGSGTTTVTALVMAVLVTAAAWSPALRASAPEVELSPIVVSRPEARPLGLRPSQRLLLAAPSTAVPRHIWDGSHALLYRYSPLSGSHGRDEVVRRAGLQ
ncbi:MAG: zf-HC2 domain-containing protein [Gemmatimonadetes bacterium]|nr:zf-HC2 domain-containing protein [Gemmatimonadota bacterium]